jgi:phage FluMu protein Com
LGKLLTEVEQTGYVFAMKCNRIKQVSMKGIYTDEIIMINYIVQLKKHFIIPYLMTYIEKKLNVSQHVISLQYIIIEYYGFFEID